MKFCRSMLFEAGRALFMKNWKIYSRKTSMVLAVKAVLKLILSHSKTIWWTSVSQNGCEVSCPLRFLAITWGVLINYDSTTANIAVFIEQRNISFQNDISLKTMRLGVLLWEKLKNRGTQGRIVSLDRLGSRRAIYFIANLFIMFIVWMSQKASKVHKLLSQSWP